MDKVFCGIDFHKRTSTIFVINSDGKQLGSTKRVESNRLLLEISHLKNPVVGIESSGGVNHMVDKIKTLGVDVRIINSNKARAIGYGGKKTDAKDAEMIARLLRADFIPEVAQRSKAARNMSLLITAREHLVTQRTATICHVRGLLREYGLTMNVGVDAFFKEAGRNIERLAEQNPMLAKVLKDDLERAIDLKKQEIAINNSIEQASADDERILRVRDIPGVGLLGAYLMIAVVDDVSRFRNASSFASYLGLVPREYSSGDSRRLGAVTKAGNETLRRYLIHGARSILSSKNYSKDRIYLWAKRIELKHGTNKASVALAHKLSRTCFALLRDGSEYAGANGKKISNEKAA